MTGVARGISVVLPVYNGAGCLAEAVASILRQTPLPLEIVIIDDGSTDGTSIVARSLGREVRYVRQDHRGPAAARNTGIAASVGDFLAFIDADDLWADGHLAALAAPFAEDPGLDVALGQVQQYCLEPTPEGGRKFRPWLQPRFCFHFGAALVRRSAFARVGPLDEALPMSEDLDWFMRAREDGLPMRLVPQPVYCYQLRATSLTSDTEAARFSVAKAVKMSLDRRRTRRGGPRLMPDLPGKPRPS